MSHPFKIKEKLPCGYEAGVWGPNPAYVRSTIGDMMDFHRSTCRKCMAQSSRLSPAREKEAEDKRRVCGERHGA